MSEDFVGPEGNAEESGTTWSPPDFISWTPTELEAWPFTHPPHPWQGLWPHEWPPELKRTVFKNRRDRPDEPVSPGIRFRSWATNSIDSHLSVAKFVTLSGVDLDALDGPERRENQAYVYCDLWNESLEKRFRAAEKGTDLPVAEVENCGPGILATSEWPLPNHLCWEVAQMSVSRYLRLHHEFPFGLSAGEDVGLVVERSVPAGTIRLFGIVYDNALARMRNGKRSVWEGKWEFVEPRIYEFPSNMATRFRSPEYEKARRAVAEATLKGISSDLKHWYRSHVLGFPIRRGRPVGTGIFSSREDMEREIARAVADHWKSGTSKPPTQLEIADRLTISLRTFNHDLKRYDLQSHWRQMKQRPRQK